eukprot:3148852-Rhodomonas_salina.2
MHRLGATNPRCTDAASSNGINQVPDCYGSILVLAALETASAGTSIRQLSTGHRTAGTCFSGTKCTAIAEESIRFRSREELT